MGALDARWYSIYRYSALTTPLLVCILGLLLFAGELYQLPHVQSHAESTVIALQPTSAHHNASDELSDFFVLGITTVARSNGSYLSNTLHSLQCALDSDAATPPVVVLNGEIPATNHTSFQTLWTLPSMRRFMRNGLVLITLGQLHPVLEVAKGAGGLPRTHGDGPERVWWRSKQVLDTAFLMEASLNISQKAQYYLQLEDDVRFSPHMLSKLYSYIHEKQTHGKAPDVVSLYNAGDVIGGVAVAYNVTFLRLLVAYLRMHYFRSPIDWLVTEFENTHKLSVDIIRPNLVQHIGIVSSLAGKLQTLASKTFEDTGAC